MVTENSPDASTSSWVWVNFFSTTEISGGSSESELNECTVMPYCLPSCVAVTTATPVVQARMAWRSFSGSRVMDAPIQIHDTDDGWVRQDKNRSCVNEHLTSHHSLALR